MSLSIYIRHEIRPTVRTSQISGVVTQLDRPMSPLGVWLSQGKHSQALDAIPMLFSICGQAHSAAARLALGQQVSEAQLEQVRLESLREYLVRLHQHWLYPLDVQALGCWMAGIGRQSYQEAMTSWYQLLPSATEEKDWLLNRQVGWEQDLLSTSGQPISLKPLERASEWQPDQGGSGAATRAANTNAGHRIAGASAWALATADGSASLPEQLTIGLEALLIDMKWMAECSLDSLTQSTSQFGVSEGWCRTSRGWLRHRVSCPSSQQPDSQQRWEILAPTDINFANQTEASQLPLLNALVEGVEAPQAGPEALIETLVRLLDPCVEFQLELISRVAEER